jgi:ribosomal protein S18 acetylase RimI-like enzyme
MADRDALHALCLADETAATGRSITSVEEIDQMLAPVHTTTADDQWLVLDAAGHPAVWGFVWGEAHSPRQDVDVYRHPQRVGEPVRGLVLDRLLARIAERGRAGGVPQVVVSAGCLADDERYPSTLRSHGFTHERTYSWMRIDLDPAVPITPRVPPGVTIEPFDPADEQQWRDLHAVTEQAFIGHYGHVPQSYEAFRAESDADPHPDLEHWRLARGPGGVLGAGQGSGRAAAQGSGWVSDLGVLPQQRGRGIARALLLAMLESYRRAGRTSVGLGVDTENTTGAVRLYESVGMRVDLQVHGYAREVSCV